MMQRRNTLLPATVLVLSVPLLSLAGFQRTYGGSQLDEGCTAARTADGGFILTGGTWSYGAGRSDAWLIRTDADGDTVWTRAFGGSSGDRGYSAAQTADGGFVVAGHTESFGSGNKDVWLIRTDADGDTLWTRTYGGSNEDVAFSVLVAADSGFVVCGFTRSSGAGERDVWLIRTDAAGDTLWTRTYGGAETDYGQSVVPTADGGYFIAGYTYSYGAVQSDFLLVKLDASGDTTWTRTYGGAGFDEGFSAVQADGGGYVVAGFTASFGAGSQDVWLIRTDADGDTLWTRTYGGTDADRGLAVARAAGGGYVVAGYTRSYGAGDRDLWLIRTDPSGSPVWDRTFGGTVSDRGFSVALTADDGYIIGGETFSFGAGQNDFWLIKTDSLGLVGIAEPGLAFPAEHAGATVVRLSRLPEELEQGPGRCAFDASGRQVSDPDALAPGVLFLRSGKATRRVLVVE